MATTAGFKEIFPEFTTVADARVASFLVMASRRVSVAYFGDSFDEAVYSLAAHILTTIGAGQGATGVIGPVSAESVGDVSVQYASSNIVSGNHQDADLRATGYGKHFLALRAERVIGMYAMGMENAP